MPDIRVNIGGTPAILTVAGDYKPGDPPPAGYSAHEEWFLVQRRAGLRQKGCPGCRRWAFPQELAPNGRICKPCAALSAQPENSDG